ncbi:hypothetical protein Tco_1551276, partial [Tanacetum coccineum]
NTPRTFIPLRPNLGVLAAGSGCSLAGSISSSGGMYSGYTGSGTKPGGSGDCGSSGPDTRWEDSRQIIATMEVDLSAGTQLVYTFPDMILSVNDFHNHVEVAIQTHGLSNTSYMGFQYSVENVVDHLTTTGITAIPGERRSIEELEGMSWHLKPPEQTSVRVPSRVAVNESKNPRKKPLNKDRRSDKPKRSRQRSREKWSTLGEPSGKWDYYVRYDAPPDTTPIE